MDDFEFDLPVPESYSKMLLNIIEEAKKHKTLAIQLILDGPNNFGGFNYKITIADQDYFYKENLIDCPLTNFTYLGLIEQFENVPKEYFLTPKAFKWAEYQNKSRIGKWFARIPNSVIGLMLVIAFIFSIVLSILQIIGNFHLKP